MADPRTPPPAPLDDAVKAVWFAAETMTVCVTVCIVAAAYTAGTPVMWVWTALFGTGAAASAISLTANVRVYRAAVAVTAEPAR